MGASVPSTTSITRLPSRTMRWYVPGSRSSVDAIVATASTRRCRRRSARMSSGRTGSKSPFATKTSSTRPTADFAASTAWPVPSCRVCSTNTGFGVIFQDATSARTSSAPCATTITTLSGRAASAVCTTCQSAGLPHTGCRTLGRADFSRLPFPAARITAASDRLDVVVVVANGCPCEGPTWSRMHGAPATRARFRGEESNLHFRLQRPASCR